MIIESQYVRILIDLDREFRGMSGSNDAVIIRNCYFYLTPLPTGVQDVLFHFDSYFGVLVRDSIYLKPLHGASQDYESILWKFTAVEIIVTSTAVLYYPPRFRVGRLGGEGLPG